MNIKLIYATLYLFPSGWRVYEGAGGFCSSRGGGWRRHMDLSSSSSVPLLLQHEHEVAAAALLEDGSNERNSSPVRKRGSGRVRGLPSLLAINALVCGVEIVSSAAFTFIPPLLLKAGYTETVMTIILGIGECWRKREREESRVVGYKF